MAFFEFPHTRTYDSDLGWLISNYDKLVQGLAGVKSWIEQHTKDYDELKELYNELDEELEQLLKAISLDVQPWDGTKSYLRYSLVLYGGVQYMAIQDVPAGVLITDTDYWQQANSILAQITLMQNDIMALQATIADMLTTSGIRVYKTIADMVANFVSTDVVCQVLESGAVIDGTEVLFPDTPNYYRWSATTTLYEYALDNGGYGLIIPAKFTDWHNDAEQILPTIMKTAYSYCGVDVRVVTANGPYKPVGQRGGIQCSQFVETLLHGLPYERSKLVNDNYSNFPTTGAFNQMLDNAGVEIYPSASGMAHYAAMKGWYKKTDKLRDVEIGDILCIADTDDYGIDWHGIDHCVMVIGKMLNAIEVIQAGGFPDPIGGYMSGRYKPGAGTDAVNMVYIALDEDTPYINGTAFVDGIIRFPMTFGKIVPTGTQSFAGIAKANYSAGAANVSSYITSAGDNINYKFAIGVLNGYTALQANGSAILLGTQSYDSIYGDTLVNNVGTDTLTTTGGRFVLMCRVDASHVRSALTVRLNTSSAASTYEIDPLEIEYYNW